jgi:Tfp pilus assembly protein PilZ
VDVHFEARVNRRIRAAIKKLSLGGCLIECNKPLGDADPLEMEFSVLGERFHLLGRVIHFLGTNQYGIQFEPENDDQALRLVDAVQKIQDASIARRSTRLKVQQEALLDKAPSLMMDLSEGGCFLRTASRFNIGDIVEVQFFLNNEEIHLAGQVRWTAPEGVGVEFLSPDPTQIGDISRFLTKKNAPSPKTA